eukprot:14920183-Ditylum_brightwellii.AAC.1
MSQADPSLFVQTGNAKETWKTLKDISTRGPFTTTFVIKQETPLKGTSQVKAYATLFSKLHLNAIKFNNEVFSYLKTQNAYVQLDMFQQNNVVSPGTIVNVHPMVVHKDNMLTEIKGKLQLCPVPKTEVCSAWISKNAPDHKDGDPAPVPDFKLVTSKAGWGNGEEQVETT